MANEKEVRKAIEGVARRVKESTGMSYEQAKQKARESARRVESKRERKK